MRWQDAVIVAVCVLIVVAVAAWKIVSAKKGCHGCADCPYASECRKKAKKQGKQRP